MAQDMIKNWLESLNLKVYENQDTYKWHRVPGTVVKLNDEIIKELIVCKLYECESKFSTEKVLKLLIETLNWKCWIPVDITCIKIRGLAHNMDVDPNSVYIYKITNDEFTTTRCVCRAL